MHLAYSVSSRSLTVDLSPDQFPSITPRSNSEPRLWGWFHTPYSSIRGGSQENHQ